MYSSRNWSTAVNIDFNNCNYHKMRRRELNDLEIDTSYCIPEPLILVSLYPFFEKLNPIL